MKFLARFRIITLAAFAVVATLLITTPSALAVQGGGIGGRPANPDPSNPRTTSIFIYQLQATQAKNDNVLIMNNTDSPQVIDIYAVDGILTNTGAYACEQAVEQKDDVGAWVKISAGQITLAANTSQKVPFTVTVPERADVGEHNGCLVFQSASDEGEVQGNVRIRTRQAIRMAVTVPGDLKKEIAIKEFGVGTNSSDGKQQFNIHVSNKGNVSSDIDASVALKTFWGQNVYTNNGGYPVLANTDLALNFVNETLPFWGGWYQASAKVSYDTRPGTYGITNDEFKQTVESQKITVFVVPNTVALFIYFAILLGIAAVITVLAKRFKENKAVRTWDKRTVKKGETITGLAAHYGISWRLLARSNKVKVPYVLNEGDTIKLPKAPREKAVKQSKKTKKKD